MAVYNDVTTLKQMSELLIQKLKLVSLNPITMNQFFTLKETSNIFILQLAPIIYEKIQPHPALDTSFRKYIHIKHSQNGSPTFTFIIRWKCFTFSRFCQVNIARDPPPPQGQLRQSIRAQTAARNCGQESLNVQPCKTHEAFSVRNPNRIQGAECLQGSPHHWLFYKGSTPWTATTKIAALISNRKLCHIHFDHQELSMRIDKYMLWLTHIQGEYSWIEHFLCSVTVLQSLQWADPAPPLLGHKSRSLSAKK